MTVGRAGRWFLIAALAGAAYWVYAKRPSPSGILDDLVRPLTHSKNAVRSAEHDRVVANASSSADRPLRALRLGMTDEEVRRLLGSPDKVERLPDEEPRARWTYGRIQRVLVFEGGRVVRITVP